MVRNFIKNMIEVFSDGISFLFSKYMIEAVIIIALLFILDIFSSTMSTAEGIIIYSLMFLSYITSRLQTENICHRLTIYNKHIPNNNSSRYEREWPRNIENIVSSYLDDIHHRLKHTGSIASASQYSTQLLSSIKEDMDTRLGLARYIAWFIPTLGFIGTIIGIRGVFQGLPKVLETMSPESINGIIEPFGVAFDTTLV